MSLLSARRHVHVSPVAVILSYFLADGCQNEVDIVCLHLQQQGAGSQFN